MVRAIVHKEEGRYLLEVSVSEGDNAGWVEGQELYLTFTKARADEITDDEFGGIAKRLIEEHREALEYLADH